MDCGMAFLKSRLIRGGITIAVSRALFFRVYVDPPGDKSDAEILCRLEYQSDKGFYLVKRVVQ
jgi:hypothetical protein